MYNEKKKRSEATQTLCAGCSKADPQANTQIHKQGRLQYTAQLSAQCKSACFRELQKLYLNCPQTEPFKPN